MALAVTSEKISVFGDLRFSTGTIAFDTSYPTGGEPIVPADVKMSKLLVLLVESNDGYVFTWDDTNDTLIAYHGNYDPGSADGPLIEVGNTSDLSGITDARYIAFGW
jgi:hypothetical protein